MKKAMIVLLVASACFSPVVQAEKLAGKNYISGSVGAWKFGDDFLDDLFGTSTVLGVAAQKNMTSNLDLQLGITWYSADGSDGGIEVDYFSSSVGTALIYNFLPQDQFNPYLAVSVAYVEMDAKMSGFGMSETVDDSDAAFAIGGGIEFEEWKALFGLTLAYTWMDSKDDVGIGANAGIWITDKVLCGVGASYAIDGEDISGDFSFVVTL